jgi:predicted 3-demethylubiquinone-9 3-methyltransferase (glyoxalase superfamily)
MTEVQKITPFLWFDQQAEEAMNYYCGVFPDSRIVHIEYYPDESLDEHFTGMKGKVITGVFELAGQQFMCLDGGPVFRFNEAVSFHVSCKDQSEIDYFWSKLSHVPESEQCGWCKDQYGVSWQIVPQNMGELMSSPAAVQAMMQMKKIDIKELERHA